MSSNLFHLLLTLKFSFSEKATKICVIYLKVLTFTKQKSKQWGRFRKFLWHSQKSWIFKEQRQISAKLIRIDWYGINAKKGKKVLTNDPEYSIGENIIPLIFVLFRSSDVSNQSWIYNFYFFSWKWVCLFSTCWKFFSVK